MRGTPEPPSESRITSYNVCYTKLLRFSRLKDSYLGKNAPVQRWLVPQVVSLPGAGRKERAEVERFLSAVGFLCEAFGENTFKISGGPAILGHFRNNFV